MNGLKMWGFLCFSLTISKVWLSWICPIKSTVSVSPWAYWLVSFFFSLYRTMACYYSSPISICLLTLSRSPSLVSQNPSLPVCLCAVNQDQLLCFSPSQKTCLFSSWFIPRFLWIIKQHFVLRRLSGSSQTHHPSALVFATLCVLCDKK